MAELSADMLFPAPLKDARATSPSLSPGRRHRRLQSTADDLPYDIPPEAILHAFTDGSLPPAETREHKYLLCSKGASSIQKNQAVRVAKVALNAKDWCRELRDWEWPGTFELPTERDRSEAAGYLEYWGSLPSAIVENYERRIDEMHNELDELDVDDLKSFLSDIHGARSRPSSSYSVESKQARLNLMDDFSLLITGALVQTLPLLAKLNSGIETWSIRLSILRGVPRFLKNMADAQRAMQAAWDAIKLPQDDETTSEVVKSWKDAVNTISAVLKSKVADLGARVDGMLDSLEGREDVIPDAWIDDFEKLEAEFGKWLVEAQRRGMELDFRLIGGAKPGNVAPNSAQPSHSLPSPALSEAPALQGFEHSNEVPVVTKSITPQDSKRNSLDSAYLPSDAVEEIRALEDAPYIPALDGVEEPEKINETAVRPSSVLAAELESQSKGLPKDEHSKAEDTSNLSPSTPNVRSEASHVATVDSLFETKQLQFGALESAPPSEAMTVPGEESESKDLKTPKHYNHVDSDSPPDDSEASDISSPMSPEEESPSVRQKQHLLQGTYQRPPPLNAAMAKRRPQRAPVPTIQSTGPEEVEATLAGKNINTKAQPQSPHKTPPMDLHTQISDILTTVPANIRLRSTADVEQAESKSLHPDDSTQALQRLKASRSLVKSPEITLSPAKSQEQPSLRRVGGGDSEIRLYHLIQPGRDKPIKLFIRSVGENGERVMVRVGGGWADLGEYLRQYAEHHGRRTVSEGKFEVLTRTGETSPVSTRDTARGSSVSPASTSSRAGDSPNESRNAPNSATPKGTPESSYQLSKIAWSGEEVGLAGPVAKRRELSDEKREWIDSMMKEARKVSSSMVAKPTTEKDFGDLGKVGGTKRLYMRSSSRQSNHADGRSSSRQGHYGETRSTSRQRSYGDLRSTSRQRSYGDLRSTSRQSSYADMRAAAASRQSNYGN